MKKQITMAALGILMIAGAMAMYAGESITFETNLTNPFYTVVGNTSSLEGLNITFDNGNITISPALNYGPDNFTLVFFDNITNEVVKIINSDSGGGGWTTKYIDNNVTIYTPEYINNTETIEVEVEKIIEKIIYVYEGYKLWHMILIGVIGLLFGAWALSNWKKEDAETTVEETGEEIE